MARRVEVCPAADLPPGERVIVEVAGLPHAVGVFNVDGEYHALANVCPHHLAPLCEGTLTGEMRSSGVGDFEVAREGEVIRCPWHGWKFDLETGRSVFNPHELGTRTYEAGVEPAGDGWSGGHGSHQSDSEDEEDAADGAAAQVEAYGTALLGEEPPVETYDVGVDDEVVVLYV